MIGSSKQGCFLKDEETEDIREDSAKAQLVIIRLLFASVTFLDVEVKSADYKSTYLQSGPVQ